MQKNYIDKYKFNNKGWIWGAIWPSLIYLGLSLIVGIIGGIIAGIISYKKDIPAMDIALSGKFNLILTLIVQILVIAIILPIYLYNRKHYYPKPKQKPTIKIILLSVCFIFLIGIPCDLLLQFIKEHFINKTTGIDLVNGIIADAPLLLSIVSVVTIGPITEELMIRGLTLNKILSRKSIIFAMILSGIIFGIIHLNLIQGLFAALAGIALAYVFIKTKSLIPCIICHIANNLLALIEINMTNKTTLIINIIIIVVCIIPSIIFIKEKEIEYE